MKIGITERGDAGLDYSWVNKLSTVDGAILITKNITSSFIMKVTEASTPIIVHATCTGWGGTWLEPHVPNYHIQLRNICLLILAGLPKENIILRIDPIIPTEEGLSRVKSVLEEAFRLRLLPDIRVRISVMDEYPHVRERLISAGHKPFYRGRFQPNFEELFDLENMLSQYNIEFESCAEPNLSNVKHVGCVSERDLKTMGLSTEDMTLNPQNRKGCLCLSCKTELFTSKHKCPHGCLYCYWKD